MEGGRWRWMFNNNQCLTSDSIEIELREERNYGRCVTVCRRKQHTGGWVYQLSTIFWALVKSSALFLKPVFHSSLSHGTFPSYPLLSSALRLFSNTADLLHGCYLCCEDVLSACPPFANNRSISKLLAALPSHI